MSGLSSRIPGLDGLRALAIALVVWMHFEVYGWTDWGFSVAWGRQGVCLFFVLSGYLITRNLMQRPCLLRFYRRRCWRIFPPFYVYLATVGLLWGGGLYQLRASAMLASAGYWMNFYRLDPGLPLEHTWSLAVEEQYYLIWPLVLRLVGARRAVVLLPGVFLFWPLQRRLRTGCWGHASGQIAFFSATYDLLLWGSLGALLHARIPPRSAWSATGAVATLLLLGLITDQIPAVLIPPLRGFSWTLLVLWVVDHPGSCLTRFLERPFLRWLGTRSYSLYLWHLLFCDIRLQPYFSCPVALALGLLCAEVSYRLIERLRF